MILKLAGLVEHLRTFVTCKIVLSVMDSVYVSSEPVLFDKGRWTLAAFITFLSIMNSNHMLIEFPFSCKGHRALLTLIFFTVSMLKGLVCYQIGHFIEAFVTLVTCVSYDLIVKCQYMAFKLGRMFECIRTLVTFKGVLTAFDTGVNRVCVSYQLVLFSKSRWAVAALVTFLSFMNPFYMPKKPTMAGK